MEEEEFDGNDRIVRISLSGEDETFNVHRRLVSKASPMIAKEIQKVLGEPAEDSDDDEAELPVIEIELLQSASTLRHFVRWLYTGSLCKIKGGPAEQIELLVQVRWLACYYDCVDFEDVVMDAFIQVFTGPDKIETSIFWAWDTYFRDSPYGMRLAADFLVHADPSKLVYEKDVQGNLAGAFGLETSRKVMGGLLEKSFTSRIIRVKCRDSLIVYNIHTHLLCQNCDQLPELFHSASGSPKSSTRDSLSLDAPRQGFEMFAKWMYTGAIQWQDRPDSTTGEVVILCKAYETGIVLGAAAEYQDKLMDEIVARLTDQERYGTCVIDNLFQAMFRAFTEGSPGRQFLFDRLTQGKFISESPADVVIFGTGDVDFCVQLAKELVYWKGEGTREQTWKDQCEYHVHRERGVGCYQGE
ncbi:hypothetical protein LTR85_005777 [Meristemomyces frigidus]|nr:hypothetical protein LTR85_005777 [Meristemomyces frigidus]